jgi:hypothetical protein
MPRTTTGLYSLWHCAAWNPHWRTLSGNGLTSRAGSTSATPRRQPKPPGKQIESANYRPADPVNGLRTGKSSACTGWNSAVPPAQKAPARQRNDRTLAEHRSTCQETRAHMHSTHDRSKRKEYSHYLRKNCW